MSLWGLDLRVVEPTGLNYLWDMEGDVHEPQAGTGPGFTNPRSAFYPFSSREDAHVASPVGTADDASFAYWTLEHPPSLLTPGFMVSLFCLIALV